MFNTSRWTRAFMTACVGCLIFGLTVSAMAKPKTVEPQLTSQGETLRDAYAAELKTLSDEVVAALPEIDAEKQKTFLEARAAWDGLVKPGDLDGPEAHKAYEDKKTDLEGRLLTAARSLLADLEPVLTSDKLDSKLIRIAILTHGTPAGLAEFAQQSDQHKALLDQLFADQILMAMMLASGGANGGEYGEAMQVYTAILAASERAREFGTIFHNLALGTALHQPWLEGQDRGSVNGIVFTDHSNPDGQVARYKHYEEAFLNGELDPAFEEFNAWECRYITNDPYTNEELAWAREMTRNFRPDHIRNEDHAWRYVRMVKSDFPYCSTRHDPSLGMPQQEALALGGVCGRRAFFGRFITRAFGIPARRSSQTGHAAMNMWTPDGWVVRLGGWWSVNWCGPWTGLDFYLDSRAREFTKGYDQVLRAQWIGDALGEEDVSITKYGQGGGLWNGLAFYKKVSLVEHHKESEEQLELAKLSNDESRLLGESDKIINDDEPEKIDIPAEYREVVVDDEGNITLPAVAVTSPENNTEKIAFLDSWNGGMQIHYQRLGNQPEVLRYRIEVPTEGKYVLTANVVTVAPDQGVIFRLNRRTLVDVTLPYTKGSWEWSDPETIELKEGRNSIDVSFRAPNRGVSIKEFQLKPVK